MLSTEETGTPATPNANQSLDKQRKVCSNCETTVASSWRRDKQGFPVCNSCSVYQRMYGIARPKDMRKDKVSARNQKDEKPQGKKKNQRRPRPSASSASTTPKRIAPTSLKSEVFKNGAEEYTDIFSRLNLTLSPELHAEFTAAAVQFLKTVLGHSVFSTHSRVTKHQPQPTLASLSTTTNNNTVEMKQANDALTQLMEAAAALERNSLVATDGEGFLGFPDMAPPAEQQQHQPQLHHLQQQREGHDPHDKEESNASGSESTSTHAISSTSESEPEIRNRVLRRRGNLVAQNDVDHSLKEQPVVVTYMVPFDILDEYSFWAFDTLEKLGVKLDDPME